MANPETILQNHITAALAKLGVWVDRRNSGGRPGVRLCEPGTPDLEVLGPVTGWIEVKLPGEDLNPSQRKWHARAKRFGHRIVVARSVSEAVHAVLAWRTGGSDE